MIFKSQKIGGIFLLVSQMFERITYYSVVSNFVYILNSDPLHWSLLNSMNATLMFSGFCFVATMFGGILADTIFKKSTTVIIGYCSYSAFVGYILLFRENLKIEDLKVLEGCSNANKSANSTVTMFKERCFNFIFPATFFSSVGSGLIKSVIASMGADMAYQKWNNPSLFFNMYYWILNLGSLISYMVIAYIQQNISRFYGFLAPGITLILSFVFFLLGLPYYVNVKKPSKTTLRLVSSIYFEALKKKMFEKKKKIVETVHEDETETKTYMRSSLNRDRVNSYTNKPSNYPSSKVSYLGDSEVSSDESSSIAETTISVSIRDIAFLDRCKIRFGGSFAEDDVENVRKFSVVLIILLFLIPYWVLYFQMETTYLSQGLHMRIPYVIRNELLPACWFSVMDIMAIMVIVPILVQVVYPFLRKKALYPSACTRVIFGMLLACLSVIIAGILHIFILEYFQWSRTGEQIIGTTSYSHSNISVFSQIPQYIIMGMSESQTIIAGLEIACTQVPSSMQGMTNGIFWFFSGVGSFIGTGLLLIFDMDKTYTKDATALSRYYFFWLAIIQIFGLLTFCVYLYHTKKRENDNIVSKISTSVTITT